MAVDLRLPELDDTFESGAVIDVPLLLHSEDDNDDKPESSPTDDVAPLASVLFAVAAAPFLGI